MRTGGLAHMPAWDTRADTRGRRGSRLRPGAGRVTVAWPPSCGQGGLRRERGAHGRTRSRWPTKPRRPGLPSGPPRGTRRRRRSLGWRVVARGAAALQRIFSSRPAVSGTLDRRRDAGSRLEGEVTHHEAEVDWCCGMRGHRGCDIGRNLRRVRRRASCEGDPSREALRPCPAGLRSGPPGYDG
jgi:hypothetical protein